MAATYRASGSGGDTSGTGDRAVTVTTAEAGDLLIVAVTLTVNTNTSLTLADDHADGLGTYHRIDAQLFAAGANIGAIFVREALLGSTDTSFVITCTSGANDSGVLGWTAFAGMTRVGEDAIRSSGFDGGTAGQTPEPALNQSALTGNPTLGACCSADSTMTEPTGWTERIEATQATPTAAVEVATRDSGFTDATITWGSTCGTAFSSFAIELDSSAASNLLLLQPTSLCGGFDLMDGGLT